MTQMSKMNSKTGAPLPPLSPRMRAICALELLLRNTSLMGEARHKKYEEAIAAASAAEAVGRNPKSTAAWYAMGQSAAMMDVRSESPEIGPIIGPLCGAAFYCCSEKEKNCHYAAAQVYYAALRLEPEAKKIVLDGLKELYPADWD